MKMKVTHYSDGYLNSKKVKSERMKYYERK